MIFHWQNVKINRFTVFEPWHDKINKVSVCPVKTQISPVWSEPSLCAQWVAKDPSFLHADNEDSDQTHFVGFVMLRLIWCMKFLTKSHWLKYRSHWPTGSMWSISVTHWTIIPSMRQIHRVVFKIKGKTLAHEMLGIIHVILAWNEIGRSAIFGREIEVPDRELFSRRKKNQF